MSEIRVYAVPAVSCDHCKQAIESEVSAVDNVERVTVDVAAKTATVVGGADVAVRSAIDEAGYDIAG